ncbi:glycosyltransferase [Endozoicomonas sp.]|uniref:glycosyltransferase family 2 protein n=1 Tax=Endozoicomonas sp. TaxID=1892382 RepID=UPI002885B87A|nr:glycosyltransferase [Endozoicomonas sp.]
MADAFRPCAIIPVFNHHQKLAGVVDALQQSGLHCIVVDDGSNEETKSALHQLQNDNTISLFQLSWNQGKGAAVMEGLMRAQQADFTHAIQIDADGQHDTGAIPDLLTMARQHPDALISGHPVYDKCVPKSRLYGRKITQFWVCIETLSTKVPDAMIGFRVYPLDVTCQLIQKTDISRRMDFDIDVMVRLYWSGIPVKSVPVRIIYPEDGLSHFDTLADNLRISWLHTRLFFGMIRRLPLLLRRFSGDNTQKWHQMQERGSGLGIRILLSTYRLLGHRAFTMLLMPVMAYFFLTGKTARQASQNYLRRLYNIAPEALPEKPGHWLSFRHFMSFGQALADRFAAWLGQITLEHLDIEGKDQVLEKLNTGQGVVLLTSHLGNIELCRALAGLSASEQELPVNVLVHTHHAEAFNRIMAEVSPDANIRLIQVDTIGPDTAILLSEMIDRGEIVAIAADRVPVDGSASDSTSVRFLGDDARFPKGPFILSSILVCPVFTVFCTRNGDNRFLLEIELFADPLLLPRKQRQEQLQIFIQTYADRLETVCKKAPLEWFNFFDFWQKSGAQD